MPIYEYRCQACGGKFDKLFRSISKIPKEVVCPICHSLEVERVMSAPAVYPKGEGGGETASETASPASEKVVFGRKELNETIRKKENLRDSVRSGE